MRGTDVRGIPTLALPSYFLTDATWTTRIAWMQMYFAVSQMYRPGAPEIELFDTNETDVQLVHGYLFPQSRLDSKGVRAFIRSPGKTQ